MRAQFGLGIVELLVTVAVAALLATIALPRVDRLLADQELRNASWRTLGAIHAARDLAISSRRPTVLCPTETLPTGSEPCSANWNLPLALFVDRNSDGLASSEEPIQARFFPLETITMRWTGFGSQRIRFAPTGATLVGNGTLRLCRRHGNERRIVINRSGRARVSIGAPCPQA